MDVNKIAKFAQLAMMIATTGLPSLIGGYKALAGIFGHDLTKEEQDAIEVAVIADAQRRKSERQLMAEPSEE